MKSYFVDGKQLRTLEEFAEHFSSQVLEGSHQGRGDLDAFNDSIHGKNIDAGCVQYLGACPQPFDDIAFLMLEAGLRIGEPSGVNFVLPK